MRQFRSRLPPRDTSYRRLLWRCVEQETLASQSGLFYFWYSYRTIVQTTGSSTGYQGGGGGLRSVLDQYTDHQLARQLACNARGNAYRFRKHLWPSTEALEAALTAHEYQHTAERIPYPLLPQFASDANGFLSGEDTEKKHPPSSMVTSLQGSSVLSYATTTTPSPLLSLDPQNASSSHKSINQVTTTLKDASCSPFSIQDKILQVEDFEGSPLSSVVPSREVSSFSPEALPGLASCVHPSPSDPAGVSWSAIGLDPVLVEAITMYTAASSPTRLQSRLIPALLHEDHHDVIFNAPRGSGATTALVLAALQGVRSESAGMNALVAKDDTSAMRLYDTILALSRRLGVGGGNRLGDVSGNGTTFTKTKEEHSTRTAPPSWLYYCTFREHYSRCEAFLKRSLTHRDGPVRLFITTADVLCELLFEKKLEFERFGYLRRVYVDDVAEQIPMLSETAPVSEMKERLRNPLAAELLLGTLHQLPGPHIRSILQLGLVSSGLTVRLKQHLLALCVKPTSHVSSLSPDRLPTTIQCFFSSFSPDLSNAGGVFRNKNAARYTVHPAQGNIRSGVLSLASPLVSSRSASFPLSISGTSCSSSAMLWWSTPALQVLRQTLTFAAALLWKAQYLIPGRVVFFVDDKTDLLRARQAFRAAGIDVKLLSEVLRPREGGSTEEFAFSSHPWRFLLLHQKDSVRLAHVAIPLVSHVMICFPPASWQAYRQMATVISNSAALTRNIGWLWVVTPAKDSKKVREVVECLDVDFINHHVDESLAAVPADIIDRRTRAPTLFGLDPQYAVQQHYEVQSENPDMSYRPREFFTPGRNRDKSFQLEDYTPIPIQMQSFKNATKLAKDVERNPGKVVRHLQKKGFVTKSLKPTFRLRKALKGGNTSYH